ncbi:MAG TPA: sulfatase-like hydrolase/transferase [Bacteroidales bacterium]|nr:sulfatase-like hydrolase/transferase [Bacteroidales bacterium]
MKKRLIALCSYTLFWLLFYIFARLFFVFFQHNAAFQNSFGEILDTFYHGLKLDISATGYFLLLPVLLLVPGLWIGGNWYRIFMRWYSYLLIVFSSIIVVSDASLYSYWGFRMDSTPLLYLKTPGEALASVSTGKLILLVSAIFLLAALFIAAYNKLIDRMFDKQEKLSFRFVWSLFFLVLCGSLIIPIRGGFGVAPINSGAVYFSQKMFLNHTAINAIWNFGRSALTDKSEKNPYVFSDLSSAKTLVDSLTVKNGTPDVVLNNTRPNIMIIVLEGFSGYVIGPLGGDSLVTPNFNRFVKEGLLFTHFYGSGTRTDKAIPAILGGYPAQPAQSIIKIPKKSQSLPSLVKILIENGYNSSFWYGGEINFANFNSYVVSSGFRSIITQSNFNPKDFNSKWGVHDHIMFNALKDSMKTVREPFINVTLTLSSHEPFDIPMDPVFPGTDNMTHYKNSVYYADKALGSFIDWAKGTDWWKNTLVILVADHGCRITSDILNYSQLIFKIPMLWMGGALTQKGIIEKYGSQVDIPVTVLNQLGIKGEFPFAKDILSKESNSFAFYTYNEGFGFMTDSSTVIYDQKLKETVVKEGADPDMSEKIGKAYLQVLFEDYLKR